MARAAPFRLMGLATQLKQDCEPLTPRRRCSAMSVVKRAYAHLRPWAAPGPAGSRHSADLIDLLVAGITLQLGFTQLTECSAVLTGSLCWWPDRL